MASGRAASVVEAIEELIRRVESGEVTSAAVRFQHVDGTWEDVTFGFATEEERDAALAKLRRALGQLH